LSVGRRPIDGSVGAAGRSVYAIGEALPDLGGDERRPVGRLEKELIHRARVRVGNRPQVTFAQNDARVEFLRQALKNRTGHRIAAIDLPKTGRSAAVPQLVTVMERPDSVARRREDFAPQNTESES